MSTEKYAQFYQKLSGPLRRGSGPVILLKVFNLLLTGIMYAAYPLRLILRLHSVLQSGGDPFRDAVLLKILLIPAGSFVLLSFIRRRINRPRPYDPLPGGAGIRPLLVRDRSGCSMPSRHVFSSVIISMAALLLDFRAGALLLTLSACSALVRVLGGIHYPSDVAAGYLAGVACGLLLFV